MKEVIALVRPEKYTATLEAIYAIGVEEFTQHRVLGRGKQRGLRYMRRTSTSGEGDMPFLPKRMVTCLVTDEKSSALVSALIKVNQTGNYGDGKVFVRPLTMVHAISTEERVAVAAP